MKKVLALVAALFCTAAVAQDRPTFILQGGYQGANISSEDFKEAKMVHGLRAGAAIDYVFFRGNAFELSGQVGLNYSMKGVKVALPDSDPENLGVTKFTMHYIDLPILFNSRFHLSNETNAFINVGPYLAYGLNAKATFEGKSPEGKVTAEPDQNLFKPLVPGEDNGMFKRFDYGIQVGAGLEYNRIMCGVSTQFGLAPVANDDKDITSKNVSFALTLGYRF